MNTEEVEKATIAAKQQLEEALMTMDVRIIQQAISDSQAVFSEGPELDSARVTLRAVKAMKKMELAIKKKNLKRLKASVIDCGKVIMQANEFVQAVLAQKMNHAVSIIVERGEEPPDIEAKIVSIMATARPPTESKVVVSNGCNIPPRSSPLAKSSQLNINAPKVIGSVDDNAASITVTTNMVNSNPVKANVGATSSPKDAAISENPAEANGAEAVLISTGTSTEPIDTATTTTEETSESKKESAVSEAEQTPIEVIAS